MFTKLVKSNLFVMSGIMLCSGSLLAQTVPDAGSILRDQQPQRQLPQQAPALEVQKVSGNTSENDVRFMVKGFTFSGYEGLVGEPELHSLVAESVGKTVGYAQLNGLVAKITLVLNRRGLYQARAYLPEQDVTTGIINIALIQVKSEGNMKFKLDKTVRVRESVLVGIGKSAVSPEQPINGRQLERALLLMNDLPGVSAKANVARSAKSGYSRVETSVSEGALITGAVWVDNYGNRYTGTWRGNTLVSLNDPLKRGDQLTLLLTSSSGLDQGRIGYSIPLLSDGLRANIAYTGLRYELGGTIAALGYKGTSNSVDAGLTYAIRRTRTSNMTVGVSYGYRNFNDTQANIDLSRKSINEVTFNLKGDSIDQFLGAGATYYTASITTGRMHESVIRSNIGGTEGNFARFNAELTRLQRLANRLNLKMSGSAQMALGNLDSSEKFSLGGPYGVRAYPISEGAGDEGLMINTDLLYTLPLPSKWGNFQLDGFYDAGRVSINHNRFPGDVSSATGRNDYWIHGIGIGLNYSYSPKAALRAIWAHSLGENPGRSIAGNNADGLNNRNQFWLLGMIYF